MLMLLCHFEMAPTIHAHTTALNLSKALTVLKDIETTQIQAPRPHGIWDLIGPPGTGEEKNCRC